ncbi:MAG: HAMP domain-containing protein [Oligoflexales bacterium]
MKILNNIRDKSFPSLENIDQIIFQVEKLKETFQALIATKDEDEIDLAEQISEEIHSSFKKIIEADSESKVVIDEIRVNFESYYSKSVVISKKFIEDELDFSSSADEIKALIHEVNYLDDKLNEFRNASYFRFTSSIDEANQSSEISQDTGIMVMLIGLTISLILLMGVHWSIVKPIIDVSKASREIGAENYDIVLTNKSSDEIGILTRNFNKMVKLLKAHHQHLDFIRDQSIMISKSASFKTLERNIADTFKQVCKMNSLNFYLSSTCFLQARLKSGFYLLEDNGEPNQSTVEKFSSQSNDAEIIDNKIRSFDFKSNDLLAVVEINSDNLDDTYYKVLDSFSGSITNALSTINLETAKNLIEIKSKEIETIFNSISQGICTLSADGIIDLQYSRHLEVILGRKNLHGMNLIDLISEKTEMGGDAISAARNALLASSDDWVGYFSINADHLPRKIVRFNDNMQSQTLELDWVPLCDSTDNVVSVLVAIRDITKLQSLEEQASTFKQKSDIIIQLVEVRDHIYADTINRCVAVNKRFTKLSKKLEVEDDDIAILRRDLHTIKGNSRAAGFTYLTDTIHVLEQAISDLQTNLPNGKKLIGKQIKIIDRDKFLSCYSSYKQVYEKILNRSAEKNSKLELSLLNPAISALSSASKTASTFPINQIKHYLQSLTSGVDKVSDLIAETFKNNLKIANNLKISKPKLNVSGMKSVLIYSRNRMMFVDCLNHLFANSFYHGFGKQQGLKNHQIHVQAE